MLKTAAFLVTTVVAASTLIAQQPPAGQAPPGGGQRGGGGGMRGPAPIAYEDHTGFQQIFDGKSLKNWDGDPAFWRVEGDAIVGESTEANPVKQNTFMIYRGGEPGDFELKVEFRINNTNSGVQYRSVQVPSRRQDRQVGAQGLPGRHRHRQPVHRHAVRGARTEIPGAARARQATCQREYAGRSAALDSSDALKSYIKDKDWNQFHVIARGGTLIHILNGHVTAVFVDDDMKNRTLKGLLGFQIHVGPPMKVEFRNVYLKTL